MAIFLSGLSLINCVAQNRLKYSEHEDRSTEVPMNELDEAITKRRKHDQDYRHKQSLCTKTF
jgi:cell division protein FtsL